MVLIEESLSDFEAVVKREQLEEYQKTSFSCFHLRQKGIPVFSEKQIERRIWRLQRTEDLCAVVHIYGEGIHIFPLDRGRSLSPCISQFNAHMERMADKMQGRKVLVLLMSRPKIFD